MEGLSLQDLMNELASSQTVASKARLSERNIVELVTKLKEMGFLARDELLHTLDGKEYVTRDRLKNDLQQVLEAGGGRVSLVELPSLLNCDLGHCESAAAALVASAGGAVFGAQGELMTTGYLDAAAAEVEEMLQAAGQVSVSDLALRLGLGAELLLRKVVEPRLGSKIQGTLEGGLLYTPAFLRNLKARLRGALRACAVPTVLQPLHRSAGTLGLPDAGPVTGAGAPDASAVSLSTFNSLVSKLAEEGAIRGSLKGAGGTWIPALFHETQERNLRGYFQSNGWIPAALFRKLSIQPPASTRPVAVTAATASDSAFSQLLTSLAPPTQPAGGGGADAKFLLLASGDLLGPQLLESIAAAVDVAVADGAWADAAAQLPSEVSAEDVHQILEEIVPALVAPGHRGAASSGRKAGSGSAATASFNAEDLARTAAFPAAVLVGGGVVFSGALLDSMSTRVQEFSRKLASETVSKGGLKKAAAATGATEKGQASAAAGGKRDALGDGRDDDWTRAPGKGRAGGRGGGGKAAKKKGGAGATASFGVADEKQITETIGIQAEEIAQNLSEWYPDVDWEIQVPGAKFFDDELSRPGSKSSRFSKGNVNSSMGLSRAVAHLLMPTAAAEYRRALAAALTGDAEEVRTAKEAIAEAFRALHKRLVLHAMGLEVLFELLAASTPSVSASTGSTDTTLVESVTKHFSKTIGLESIEILHRWAALEYRVDLESAPEDAASSSHAVNEPQLKGKGKRAKDRTEKGKTKEDADEERKGDEDKWYERPLTAAQCSKICKQLPSDVAAELADVINRATALQGRVDGEDEEALVTRAKEFGAAVFDAAGAIGMRTYPRMDRKAIKAAAAAEQVRLEAALTSAAGGALDPLAALATALPLAFLKITGFPIALPGKCMAPVIALMKKALSGIDPRAGDAHVLAQSPTAKFPSAKDQKPKVVRKSVSRSSQYEDKSSSAVATGNSETSAEAPESGEAAGGEAGGDGSARTREVSETGSSPSEIEEARGESSATKASAAESGAGAGASTSALAAIASSSLGAALSTLEDFHGLVIQYLTLKSRGATSELGGAAAAVDVFEELQRRTVYLVDGVVNGLNRQT